MSSTFGQSADFGDHKTCLLDDKNGMSPLNSRKGEAAFFHKETAGEPLVEPIFGTRYWSHIIPDEILEGWKKVLAPQMPPSGTNISLPPTNPFIPNNFEVKELPDEDYHHPLLFCSLKICVHIGKKKVRMTFHFFIHVSSILFH